MSQDLSLIEQKIIEKFFQYSTVLDPSYLSIEKVLSDDNLNNIYRPKKNLVMNIINIADKYLLNSFIDVITYQLSYIIYTYVHYADRQAIISGINNIKKKITCVDDNIKNITFKEYNSYFDASIVINTILSTDDVSLLFSDNAFIDLANDYSNSMIGRGNIDQYCYKILLQYYINLQYTKSYIEYVNQYLMDCIRDRKIGYIRIGLITSQDISKKYDKLDTQGHATVMIFNGINRTLEFFDPNGETKKIYDNIPITNLLRRVFYGVLPEIVNFQPTFGNRYLNLQSRTNLYDDIFEELQNLFDFGICGLYSLWFLHQRLLYITSPEYYKRLTTGDITKDDYVDQSKQQYLSAALYYESKPITNESGSIINPLSNYQTLDESELRSESHTKILLANHESILKYGKSFLQNIKIGDSYIWDYTADLIEKYKNESSLEEEKISDVISTRLDTIIKKFDQIYGNQCVNNYEYIHDYQSYLFAELRDLFKEDITLTKSNNNALIYLTDQASDYHYISEKNRYLIIDQKY